jgi:hypothetical protein
MRIEIFQKKTERIEMQFIIDNGSICFLSIVHSPLRFFSRFKSYCDAARSV